MTTSTASPIVACNIYITAASSHASSLLSAMMVSQDHCRQLRNSNAHNENQNMASVAIIHAYADIPYDRSSFHLAGMSDCVTSVASKLICTVLNEIKIIDNKDGNDKERHPYVGLVDHVSVMPISYLNDGSSNSNAAAKAAQEIGRNISTTNLVNVHYYGNACPNNTSLATIRRERTSFFKSGGAVDKDTRLLAQSNLAERSKQRPPKGDSTIGVPTNFVENFNIRLTSNVSFDQAKTLTQFVRGRNIETKGYGVLGVESLTLPYVREGKQKVYEVACNLTNPKEGSVDDVQSQLKKWIEMQKQQQQASENTCVSSTCKLSYDYFVEEAYRVGTTEEQCLNALAKGKNDEMFWDDYDAKIYCRFRELLK